MPDPANAAHPSVPLLPAQRDTALANIEPGVWKPLGTKDLLELSDRFDAKAQEDARINSIPDLWARPLLFQLALYDDRHSLHKRVVGEWRGLLAVLAFKERRQLPVRPVVVAVGGHGGALLAALDRLTPLNTLHASASWRALHLLTWRSPAGEQPIGMLSPTTLVVTAASCQGRIDRLSWFDFNTQCLRDPSPFLNAAEKADLANWLAALRTGIAGLTPPPPAEGAGEGFEPVKDMHDKLLKQLDAFILDLGVVPAATPPADLIDAQHGFGFESELYAGMNHPLRALAFNAQQSHVRLVPSAGRQPARDALVLDPSIERQFGRSAREIIVYDTLDLSQALAHPDQATAHRDRVNVWEKRYFFTDRLLCVAGITNAFPGARPIRGADALRHGQGPLAPLPPLRAEILEYLSAADLAQGLSFQQEGDAIKVNLIVNLSGPDGRARAVTLDRVYRDTEIERVESLPIIEVWPNLASGAGREGHPWKSYFTYFSTPDSGDYLFADPQGHPLTFAAQPYPKTDPAQSISLSDGRREVRRMERFPEAFVCTANRPPARSAQEPVGLLLLPSPREVGGQPSEWSVGIDFGTSSTHVYYRPENEAEPRPMRFQDHTLAVTGQKQRDAELYREFVPGQEVPTPFLTLFRIRDANRRLAGARPILDGTILYLGQQSAAFDAADIRLRHNLKWSKSSDDQEATLAFLRQLALQCAVEALEAGANAVRWCFSYPSAFSDQQTDIFRANWTRICADTEKETGVRWITDSGQPRRPLEKTESLAVACYFIELHHATPASGAVFVDIGGGTTDISIWYGGGQNRRDLQLQTSVLYAGREMFTQPLHLFGREILPNLLTEDRARDRLRDQLGKFPTDQGFARLVDMVVTQHNDAFMHNLPRLSGREDSEKLKAALALRVCGLLHYVGLLVRAALRPDAAGEPGLGERMPHFFFGGNGARVLNWLELGTFSDAGTTSRMLLKPILAVAAGFPPDAEFRLSLSEQPKAEVAAGLVVPDTPETPAGGKPRTVAGEAFTLPDETGGRHDFPWSGALTKDGFAGKLQLTSLDQFQGFLQYYSQLVAADSIALPAPGPMTSMQASDVFNRVQDHLTPNRREEVVVEPLFILALKEYLALRP